MDGVNVNIRVDARLIKSIKSIVCDGREDGTLMTRERMWSLDLVNGLADELQEKMDAGSEDAYEMSKYHQMMFEDRSKIVELQTKIDKLSLEISLKDESKLIQHERTIKSLQQRNWELSQEASKYKKELMSET